MEWRLRVAATMVSEETTFEILSGTRVGSRVERLLDGVVGWEVFFTCEEVPSIKSATRGLWMLSWATIDF